MMTTCWIECIGGGGVAVGRGPGTMVVLELLQPAKAAAQIITMAARKFFTNPSRRR
jgi:hypothetical protein